MGNKIVYGCQNFCCIPHVTVNGQKSLDTPVLLDDMGMVSQDSSLAEELTKVYGDNKLWARLNGAKEYTIALIFRYLSARYLEYVGYKQHPNGGHSDTGSKQPHGICYETLEYDDETGEESTTLHYYYNVVASRPTVPTRTKEENIEAGELSIEFSGTDCEFVFDKDGKKVAYFEITRTEENKALYDTFKDNAIEPTTPLPTSA